MNLSYPILWIDDQITSVKGSAEDIEEYLDELGYEPDVQLKSPVDDLTEMLADPRWNLIAMDYQLTNDLTGKELIQEIRKSQYTEVIFYSSEPELVENAIMQEALEGVYWASREDDELEEKIKKIINITLKKVMDVNTMRGIVMAEVADIDHQMEDIIKLHHSKVGDSDQKKLQSKILERVGSSLASNVSRIEKLKKACSLDDCLDFRVIDSDKRLRTVQAICTGIKIAGPDEERSFTSCRQILGDRNLLAHGRTTYEDNREFVKSGDKEFSLDDAIGLRKALREQRKNFKKLLNSIEEHHKQ